MVAMYHTYYKKVNDNISLIGPIDMRIVLNDIRTYVSNWNDADVEIFVCAKEY